MDEHSREEVSTAQNAQSSLTPSEITGHRQGEKTTYTLAHLLSSNFFYLLNRRAGRFKRPKMVSKESIQNSSFSGHEVTMQ